MPRGQKPNTVSGMDNQLKDRGTGAADVAEQRLYRDLRLRNERRAELARLRNAQRHRRIEQALQATRQRRFDQRG